MRHKEICVRNEPTAERAAVITSEIRNQLLYSSDHVEVRFVPEVNGYGLFTTEPMVANQIITSYTGMRITRKEINDVLYDTSYEWSDKLYHVNVDSHFALGSFGGYINDALDPNEHEDTAAQNCSIVERTVDGELRVVVVADYGFDDAGVQLRTSYGAGYWQEELSAGALPPALAERVVWAYPKIVAPDSPLVHQSVFTHPRNRVPLNRERRPREGKHG
jgi:hypothetical protein